MTHDNSHTMMATPLQPALRCPMPTPTHDPHTKKMTTHKSEYEWMHTPATNHKNNWTPNDPCKDNKDVMTGTHDKDIIRTMQWTAMRPRTLPHLDSMIISYELHGQNHSLYSIPYGLHIEHMGEHKVHSYSVIIDITLPSKNSVQSIRKWATVLVT